MFYFKAVLENEFNYNQNNRLWTKQIMKKVVVFIDCLVKKY
jgi:hypothetical protein